MATWIQIHIWNSDPDLNPGGLKRAKMKEKIEPKYR
jgi:hypothetical protein